MAVDGADGVASLALAPGQMLPDIALASTRGGTVSLARAAGRNVFYAYPWTGRPGLPNPPNWDDIAGAHGSTPEAEGFRDCHAALRRAGVRVYGISTQETAYQQEFARRLGLPFALLSDADFRLQAALALPTFHTGGVAYLRRLTFVARDGVVETVFYPVEDAAAHAAQVLDFMQRDGV